MTTEVGNLVSSEYRMKMKIFSSFRQLMDTMSIEQITVRSLCQNSEISRSTFYKHFSDKYEIPIWYARLLARYGVYETGRSLSWKEGMWRTLEGMRAIDPMFQKLGKSWGNQFLIANSVTQRTDNLRQTIQEFAQLEVTPRLFLQTKALAYAETYLTNEWLMQAEANSAERFIEDLYSTIPSELLEILDNPSTNAADRPMFSFNPFTSRFS